MRSRSTPTGMPARTSPTGCVSRPANGTKRHGASRRGQRRPCGTGEGGTAIIEGAPVSYGRDAQVTEAGDYRFFAGWRSDPFFFDAGGALNNFQFTGDDFFADKDVCSIAFELPNSELGFSGSGSGSGTGH